MISKLPRWVEYGSFLLALVAGLVNAIGLLGFDHQAVSHLSGTVTLLGAGVLRSAFSDVFHLLAVLFSFLIGAAISGYFLRDGALHLSRYYSRLLSLEAVMLFGSVYFFTKNYGCGHYLASAACGLQNALVTAYSGTVIRTTHVTGIFTDLGIMLGSALRGEPFDRRKASLFLLIIFGFMLGGTFGAYLFGIFGVEALYVPAGICLVLALLYSVVVMGSTLKRFK